MTDITIRHAVQSDSAQINTALHKLSKHMGDHHAITTEELGNLLFQAPAKAEVLIAETGGEIVGCVMYSPFISTTKGGLSLYVSDLWVDETMRGRGLGPQLMAAAVDRSKFDVKTIRLAVYHDNPKAFETYLRLGFKADRSSEFLSLDRNDFKNIRGKK